MSAFFKNKLTYLFLATSGILMIFNRCDGIFSWDKGDIIRKEVRLDIFNHIRIYGIYDIILRQDTIHQLTIEGAEDFITDIEVRVENDTLIIEDMHKDLFRIEEMPTLYVHFTDLKYLWTFKPVHISNEDTLKLDRFYFYPIGEIGEAYLTVQCNFFGMDNSANTLGRFSIRGTAQNARFYNRYGSSIYADSLKSQVVYVYNESVGDVYVYADELLKVFIWGSGDIYHSGNATPEIVERKGSGMVLRL